MSKVNSFSRITFCLLLLGPIVGSGSALEEVQLVQGEDVPGLSKGDQTKLAEPVVSTIIKVSNPDDCQFFKDSNGRSVVFCAANGVTYSTWGQCRTYCR